MPDTSQSPFPGMDPYLEASYMWPGLRTHLMAVLSEQLIPLIVPKYIAGLKVRMVIDESVPTRHVSVHIWLRETRKLVTVIELLAPVNKRPGEGRREYLAKRADFLDSNAHFIEIDLLRSWPRMPLEGSLPPCDYLVVVSDAYERPNYNAWPISLRQSLPVLPVPLLRSDLPVPLDLGWAVRTVYARGRFDLQIDYSQPPEPPLSDEDATWLDGLLGEMGRG